VSRASTADRLRDAEAQLINALCRAECGADFIIRMEARTEVKKLRGRVARLRRSLHEAETAL
jgi:hypothetical protein